MTDGPSRILAFIRTGKDKYGPGVELTIGGATWSEFAQNMIEVVGQDGFEDALGLAVNQLALDSARASGAVVEQAEASLADAGLNPTPANSDVRTCRHGEMVKRHSKPDAAKKWSAWMCPQPRDATDKCDPVWLR